MELEKAKSMANKTYIQIFLIFGLHVESTQWYRMYFARSMWNFWINYLWISHLFMFRIDSTLTYALPEINSKSPWYSQWLKDDPFLLGSGLIFRGEMWVLGTVFTNMFTPTWGTFFHFFWIWIFFSWVVLKKPLKKPGVSMLNLPCLPCIKHHHLAVMHASASVEHLRLGERRQNFNVGLCIWKVFLWREDDAWSATKGLFSFNFFPILFWVKSLPSSSFALLLLFNFVDFSCLLVSTLWFSML